MQTLNRWQWFVFSVVVLILLAMPSGKTFAKPNEQDDCAQPVPAPTLVGPTHRSHTTDTTPRLSWQDATYSASHRIYILSPDHSFQLKQRVSTVFFEPSTPLSAGKYKWRVRAQDYTCQTWSAWSDRSVFFVDAPNNAPLAITSFSANPTVVARGENITFTWTTTGASHVSIWAYNAPMGGEIGNQAPNGSYTYTIPAPTSMASGEHQLLLRAYNESGQYVDMSLPITLNCPWTRAELYSDYCPQEHANLATVYQPFEHGFMMWRGDRQQIYVFTYTTATSGTHRLYNDTWTGQAIVIETPPAGFYAPERGFGYLWSTNSEVRNALGWATAPEEGYSAIWESLDMSHYPQYTTTLPNSTIINIHSLGSWSFQ